MKIENTVIDERIKDMPLDELITLYCEATKSLLYIGATGFVNAPLNQNDIDLVNAFYGIFSEHVRRRELSTKEDTDE